MVSGKVYDRLVERFGAQAAGIRVGNSLEPDTRMGPLITQRRRQAVEDLIADARAGRAEVTTGGNRIGTTGNFLEPTVLTGVTAGMRIMNEEPFGPVALMQRFDDLDEAVAEANPLPYGLAAYAFSRSAAVASALSTGVETGMLTMHHLGLALPEVPFGGVKDSGYGSESGTEAMEPYFTAKFGTHVTA